jgi:hypothetical protein
MDSLSAVVYTSFARSYAALASVRQILVEGHRHLAGLVETQRADFASGPRLAHCDVIDLKIEDMAQSIAAVACGPA